MTELYKIIYLFGIAIGAWTALSLFIKASGNQQANKMFAILLVILLFPLSNAYVQLTSLSTPITLIKLLHKFSWLYGPCLYLFIQMLLNKPINTYRAMPHFLPFIALAIAIVSNTYFESLWLAMATFAQIGAYLAISALTLFKHRQQVTILFKQFAGTSLYWFSYVIFGLFLFTIFETLVIAFYLKTGGVNDYLWHSFMSLHFIFILTIASFSLYAPNIFYNDLPPYADEPENRPPKQANEKSQATQEASKFKELNEVLAKALASQLDAFMETNKPFLRNDLKLQHLAEQLKVSTHQLSELLNVYLKQNFYDYVNQARFNYALTLLHDPKCKMSILDLAYQSGFNNKNTFYKVFKNATQMTPSAYRKQVKGKTPANSSFSIENDA